MSKQILQDVRVFVGSADLSGSTNKVEIKRSVDNKETTNFRSGGAQEFVGGLQSCTADVEGFFESDGATLVDDVLPPLVGVVGPWTVCPSDATVGALAYTMNMLEGEYSPAMGGVGDVAGFKASAVGGPRGRGVILHPPGTARTATGTGTAVLVGSVASGRALMVNLHVHSITGTATPTVTVRVESDDNAGFTSPLTVATFTAATAIGGQSVTVLGPITDNYFRAAWTISGTTPSMLFTVALGIA